MENETLVPQVVVIGYGNTLRSDDGAGQLVAESVEKWGLPNVRSHSVHQLTPELAEPISTAKLVIFVDAYPINKTEYGDEIAIQVQAIQPTETKTQIGHTADPRSLLTLTQMVYGVSPSAWWILIPAINFEFGEQLSLITQKGIQAALEQINQLIQQADIQVQI